MLIGPAALSYLVYDLLKTGENRWNRCTLGGVGINQYQTNIVCDVEPLKFTKVVTYEYLNVWSVQNWWWQVKTGEKGETGVHLGGTDVEQQQMNVVYQYDPLKLKT